MVESFGMTDAGCVRTNNEDYFLLAPALGLYVIADGMGGAQAGEHASRIAAETVHEIVQAGPHPLDEHLLSEAVLAANQRVISTAQSDPGLEGMGTTLVAVADSGEDFLIASVGDSRAYVYNGSLKPITEDQTWVNEVGRRLGLDEDTLKNHQMRHVLTMAIGVTETLRVNSYRVPHTPGAHLLLSSDGLHGVASDEEITEILASSDSLETKCRRLIDAARAKGGPDNITVVLLKLPR